MQETKFEAPSWEYVYELLIKLGGMIRRSGFKPDIIVGVSRGGWIPARILSDLLDNPNLANIKVEFYTNIYKKKEQPIITQPISVPIRNKRILIVDDVVDTGLSMRLIHAELLKEAEEVKTVTLYYKPWGSLKPDYYSKCTEAWIVFPWEINETTKTIFKKMRMEGKNSGEIRGELKRMGFTTPLLKKFLTFCFCEEK